MDFSKHDMKVLKGLAILFMLLLHLFCRKNVNGLYYTLPLINGVPLIYYIALFADACVPVYLFSSGYGLFSVFNNGHNSFIKSNLIRIFKLLFNYWIVLVIFVSIGFFAGVAKYPGSLTKFLLNFFVLSTSYNGAWWFVQTYIILVLLTPWLFKMINKYKAHVLIIISGGVYLISYIQRFKQVLDFGDNILLNAIILVGTSQLPFVIGAVFAKDKIYAKLLNKFSPVKYKNTICLAGILALVLIHSFYESMIIAPLTGITFICLFSLMKKGLALQKLLGFFGGHSTNIWLVHMFFYMTIFPKLTFAPWYPVLIFIWLVILSLIASYFINFMYRPVWQLIDQKLFTGVHNHKQINNLHQI